MKVKLFSTSFQPAQEKYERFSNFESDINEFIATVKVIDIKYSTAEGKNHSISEVRVNDSTAAGLCHDAQTHVNEFTEDFSALVMYEEL